MASIRRVLAVLAIVGCLAASACTRHGSTVQAGADPTVSAPSADALIVGLDDVRRITEFPGLTSDPALDVHQPRGMHQYDAQYPQPCRAHFDQDAAFDTGWKQFRSVGYTGSSNHGVTQAVGVYPDAAAARAAFDHLTTALTACAGLHIADFPLTVRQLDPTTIALCSEQCGTAYRVKSAVLINVSVQHFGKSAERIANSVLAAIADRIPTG